MDSQVKHISKICRLCLSQQPPVRFSVFENNIGTMIEALTSKMVRPTDVLTIVCLKCVLNLKLVYNFQQKIKQCEEKFKQSMAIKQEACTSQLENITIGKGGNVKLDPIQDKNLAKLCDNCFICGERVDDGSINNHIRTHFDEKQKCDSCDTSFTSGESFRLHLLKHPEKIINQCCKCGAKFYYKPFYDVHVKTECVVKKPTETSISVLNLRTKQARDILTGINSKRKRAAVKTHEKKEQILKFGLRSSQAIKVLLRNETNETYTCKECGKQFVARKTFQAHTHKTKKCGICNRDVSMYNFRRHLENHTSGPQVCHLCGATLQNKSSLVTHIFYSHNHLRYKCEECGKAFKKKHIRDSHMSKYHLRKPTHCCDHCGKGFYRGKFLQKHIQMTHLKLRPHICSFCNKGFSSLYALKTHRRQHTNETPYKCDVCGEGFRQNVSLKGHKKSKHNIEELKTCSCQVCGKRFASEVGLHAHMRVH